MMNMCQHVTRQISFFNKNMDVSKNSGTPKSSILIGFSIINHPFWGTTIFGNTHMDSKLIRYFLFAESFKAARGSLQGKPYVFCQE